MDGWGAALRRHWPEYAIEAACLGIFMLSACSFTVLLEHPDSPVHRAIPDPMWRRVLMGCAMGGTAIALIYSPWGKRSGAHLNPALTLAFLRLGKVPPRDGALYIVAQFAGACAGVLLAGMLLGAWVRHPAVHFATTMPGPRGPGVAFAAELAITFVLMLTVLEVSNTPRWARFTGICAGLLVALYITFEAPLSGMSMNPARTFGSAWGAHRYSDLWVYGLAPPLGMQLAAAAYVAARGRHRVHCAKLHHESRQRCIFCAARRTNPTAGVAFDGVELGV